MRIIIDGNDGVGKTTLAKRLQKDLDIKSYIHLSYNDPTNLNFYWTLNQKVDVIFDRSFIDERIYSQVLGRHCSFDEDEEADLHWQLAEYNYKVIICHTPKKNNKNDEHSEILENEKVIDEYFRDIAIEYGYIYYDPINESYKELLNKLKGDN